MAMETKLARSVLVFTRDGAVADEMFDNAKAIFSVGREVGKIDQVREIIVVPEGAD